MEAEKEADRELKHWEWEAEGEAAESDFVSAGADRLGAAREQAEAARRLELVEEALDMADTDDGGSETGSWRGVSAEPAHGAKTETAVDEGAVVGTNEVAPGVK